MLTITYVIFTLFAVGHKRGFLRHVDYNKFIVCVNIPANKVHSDSDSTLKVREIKLYLSFLKKLVS